jgi:hypothetical protein
VRTIGLVATGAALVTLAGCAGSSQLEDAGTYCRKEAGAKQFNRVVQIADEGHTLIIKTTGEDDLKGYLNYLCVTNELGTPTAITSRIGETTSLMGQQQGKSDGLEYEWSYHPDNGLYVLITDGQA